MISHFRIQISDFTAAFSTAAYLKSEFLNLKWLGMDRRDVYTWGSIALIVIGSTAGEVLIAKAMQRIGDLGELRRRAGLGVAIRAVVTESLFWLGILFMALGYFSLLIGLSWADVSLLQPASASLTFVTNAIAARMFLHEKVDARRWLAAVFVAAGVALLSL
jgi:drug/metabolite transporter (DMT)-like permease